MAIRFAAILAALSAALVPRVAGHARLLNPPSRGTAWRLGFNTPRNYGDHETNCGGFQAQHGAYGGKCGVCGDPYGGPMRHEPGPLNEFATGTIVSTFRQGQVFVADVEVTVSHKGFYEFRLCQNDKPQLGRDRAIAVGERCFSEFLLKSPDGKERFEEGLRNITLKLPDDVSCTACVLQWRWKAGNSWGCQTEHSCGLGQGDQEEFRACADIEITPSNNLITHTFSRRYSQSVATSQRTTPATRRSDGDPERRSDDRSFHRLMCFGLPPWGRDHDGWCNVNCNHVPPFCPSSHCRCTVLPIPR